jgi:hypothetical protein
MCLLHSLLSVQSEQEVLLMQVAAPRALLPGHGACALPSYHSCSSCRLLLWAGCGGCQGSFACVDSAVCPDLVQVLFGVVNEPASNDYANAEVQHVHPSCLGIKPNQLGILTATFHVCNAISVVIDSSSNTIDMHNVCRQETTTQHAGPT